MFLKLREGRFMIFHIEGHSKLDLWNYDHSLPRQRNDENCLLKRECLPLAEAR